MPFSTLNGEKKLVQLSAKEEEEEFSQLAKTYRPDDYVHKFGLKKHNEGGDAAASSQEKLWTEASSFLFSPHTHTVRMCLRCVIKNKES